MKYTNEEKTLLAISLALLLGLVVLITMVMGSMILSMGGNH